MSDTFQSKGACQKTCAKYALGVLQGKKCWCTNVAPSKTSQQDTVDCDTGCPGFPDDSCGSASKGVFAYVSVTGNDVTSTAGGSTSSTTTSTSSVSNPPFCFLLHAILLLRLRLVKSPKFCTINSPVLVLICRFNLGIGDNKRGAPNCDYHGFGVYHFGFPNCTFSMINAIL